MSVAISDVLQFLAERALEEDIFEDCQLTGVSPVAPGAVDTLSFATVRTLANPSIVTASLSAAVLVPPNSGIQSSTTSLIAVKNPRLEFARVANHFFVPERSSAIDPTATVSERSILGESCSIGPGVRIAEGVHIGSHCTIESNSVIFAGTVIGNSTHIGPNSSIGSPGFGFERDEDGVPVRIPHFGGVRIGNNVEIGANACIDRGTFADTTVHDHVKIDNLVHVAHNCVIEEGAFVIAGAVVGGGVHIGERSWISINASVREQLVIGSDATVGMGSVVTRNVDTGATVVGNPAHPIVLHPPEV